MSAKPLLRVSVAVRPEAEEAVSALLEAVTGVSPCSYHDFETGRTTITVYLPSAGDWTPAMRAALWSGLRDLRRCGVQIGPGRISTGSLRAEAWKDSWKRHFKVLNLGPRLLIRPSWSKRRPRPGQALVVLDPGLSFGTGQHPTTAFCLRQLVAFADSDPPPSCLDIGTGSGILAIAAAKLKFAPVHAFDLDPEAVRIARENARRNHVAERIEFARCDLARLPLRAARKFSVICANLVSNLLIEQQGRILSRLAPGGALILAGILDREFSAVRRAYAAAGLRLRATRVEGEWRSGTFSSRNF